MAFLEKTDYRFSISLAVIDAITGTDDSIVDEISAEAIEADRKKYPLGYGKPEDVANLALFLLSDKSSWITATTITIDGGRSNILN